MHHNLVELSLDAKPEVGKKGIPIRPAAWDERVDHNIIRSHLELDESMGLYVLQANNERCCGLGLPLRCILVVHGLGYLPIQSVSVEAFNTLCNSREHLLKLVAGNNEPQ